MAFLQDPNQPNAPGEYYLVKTNSKGDLGNVDADNSVIEFFEDRDIGVIQSTALLQQLNPLEFKAPSTSLNNEFINGDPNTNWPGLTSANLNYTWSGKKGIINSITITWIVDPSDWIKTGQNFAKALLEDGVDKDGNTVTWSDTYIFIPKKGITITWGNQLGNLMKAMLANCVQDLATSVAVESFFQDIADGITQYSEIASGGSDTTLSDKNALNVIDALNRLFAPSRSAADQLANNPKGVKSFEQVNSQYDVLAGNINSIIGPVFSSSIFNDFIDYTKTNNLISGITQNYTLVKQLSGSFDALEITGLINSPDSYKSGEYLVSTENGAEWRELDLGNVDFTGLRDTPTGYNEGQYLISSKSGISYASPSSVKTLPNKYDELYVLPPDPNQHEGELVLVTGGLYISNQGKWKTISQTDFTKVSQSAKFELPESVNNVSEVIEYNSYIDKVTSLHSKSNFIMGLNGEPKKEFSLVSVSPHVLGGINTELYEGGNKTYIQETSYKWGVFNDDPTINLVAEPGQYCQFSHWDGGSVADPNSASTTILADQNLSITGCFNCAFPSYIKLPASLNPAIFEINTSSLAAQAELEFKMDGQVGEFALVEDLDSGITFTLTLGGSLGSLSVLINDGSVDVGNLNLNDSINYTLPSGSIITFSYFGVGSVLFKIIKKSDPIIKSSTSITGGSDINVSVDNGNFVFNGTSSSDNIFGINKGTHYFKNVPDSHPMAFFIESGSLDFRYGGTVWAGSKVNAAGKEIHYFSGDIVLEISEDFSFISYDCMHHGYMGGENNLIFDSSALANIEPKWTINFDTSQYTDGDLTAEHMDDIRQTFDFLESVIITNLNTIGSYELSLVNPSVMKKTSGAGGVLASARWVGTNASTMINGLTLTPNKGEMQIDPIDAPMLSSFEPRQGKSGLFFVVLHELCHALGIASDIYNYPYKGKILNPLISITREGGSQYTGKNGVKAYNKITNLDVSSTPMHTNEFVVNSTGSTQQGQTFSVESNPITQEDLDRGYVIHNNRWSQSSNSRANIPSGLTVGDTFNYIIYVYGQAHTAEFDADSPIIIDGQEQVVLCESLMSPLIDAPYFGDFDELTMGMLTDMGWIIDFSKKIV
jgi:hypothetical protein